MENFLQSVLFLQSLSYISKKSFFFAHILYKVTVLDNGNGVTNLAACSINSYFEVYKDKYCIVNVEDKNLIINSNGYHYQIPYYGSVINYGIHYDCLLNNLCIYNGTIYIYSYRWKD